MLILLFWMALFITVFKICHSWQSPVLVRMGCHTKNPTLHYGRKPAPDDRGRRPRLAQWPHAGLRHGQTVLGGCTEVCQSKKYFLLDLKGASMVSAAQWHWASHQCARCDLKTAICELDMGFRLGSAWFPTGRMLATKVKVKVKYSRCGVKTTAK